MLEKASKSVWELILDSNGLGKEISETVERVFCRLSGREAPLFVEAQPDRAKDEPRGKEKHANVDNGTDEIHSASKKRSFGDMN